MVGERIGQPVTLRVLRADRALELSIVPTELQIRAR